MRNHNEKYNNFFAYITSSEAGGERSVPLLHCPVALSKRGGNKRCVSFEQDENPVNLVLEIGIALGVKINADDIDSVCSQKPRYIQTFHCPVALSKRGRNKRCVSFEQDENPVNLIFEIGIALAVKINADDIDSVCSQKPRYIQTFHCPIALSKRGGNKRCVSFEQDENPVNLILEICIALGVKISADDIDSVCSQRPPSIIFRHSSV
ncbi:hypothetical protein O3M35_003775 [Rhynocoris fuscipes]|uniref:Uncharacterized protein n=1 Tax=Rhynocoris fuscipes TaxID=488301 RepID=A0AAW1CK45_9HEMI